MDISPWDRRVYSQNALDETRDRLSDKRMRRALGANASSLYEIAMNLRVVDNIDGGKIEYQPDYQDTEMIPLTCSQPGEVFFNMMIAHTPQQRMHVQRLIESYTAQYGAIDNGMDPQLIAKYQFSDLAGAITWATWIEMHAGTQKLGALTRPLVMLKWGEQNIARSVSVLIHELSHVQDIITNPVTHLPRENRSLQTELRAYHTQFLANKLLLHPDDMSRIHPARVERIRSKYNGSANGPNAFTPKLAIKRALADAGLSSIYLRQTYETPL